MSQSVCFGWRCLPLLVFTLAFTLSAGGQEKKLKDLKWSHAFDLACRKYEEADITKDTKRWGVEAFRDDNTGQGLYFSQAGSLAAAPHFQNLTLPITPSKGPVWLTGLDLPARKAGEKEFTKTTTVYSMEVFRDPNTENWLFITDLGNIAATNGKLFPGVANKTPKWIHSVDLAVRKGGVKEWKDAAKFGIEVYRDGNTGNLIYVTENGSIAIIPEVKEVPEGKGKAPDWLHGLDLSCRKHRRKGVHQGHPQVRRRSLQRSHHRQPDLHQRDRQHHRHRRPGRCQVPHHQGQTTSMDARPGREVPPVWRKGILRADTRFRRRRCSSIRTLARPSTSTNWARFPCCRRNRVDAMLRCLRLIGYTPDGDRHRPETRRSCCQVRLFLPMAVGRGVRPRNGAFGTQPFRCAGPTFSLSQRVCGLFIGDRGLQRSYPSLPRVSRWQDCLTHAALSPTASFFHGPPIFSPEALPCS